MPEHDELPLPDYDHLNLGSLTSRVRRLDTDGVQALLGYERAHGNRVQVVVVLENRLAALKAGAQPSGGDPAAPTPETPRGEPAGSKVGSKVSEATAGPPVNPPSQGDPTNPAPTNPAPTNPAQPR